MGGIISKPKAPDTSAIRAQEARLAEQERKQAEEEKKRQEKADRERKAEANARRGRSGRASLLTGLETGVQTDEKRSTLG